MSSTGPWPTILERFHNSRAFSGIFKGGFFLNEKATWQLRPWCKQL